MYVFVVSKNIRIWDLVMWKKDVTA